MHRTLLAATLLMILAAPPASAGWFGRDDVAFTTAPERVGDKVALAIDVAWTDEDGPRSSSQRVVYQVEGPSSAVDRYGITRSTVAYRVDRLDANGTLLSIERCHRLSDGVDGVRTDILSGEAGWSDEYSMGGGLLTGTSRVNMTGTRLAHFWSACPAVAPQGRAVAEGQRIPFGELFPEPGLPAEIRDYLSEPAAAASFAGRAALDLRFDLLDMMRLAGETSPTDGVEGIMRMVLADGLPGIALMEIAFEPAEGEGGYSQRHEIVGFAQGDGAPTPFGSTILPERHPTARFVAPDPLGVPDDALDLPFPYAAALAAIRADPALGFDAWLASHPNARLASAFYDAEVAPSTGSAVLAGDGVWFLTFSDGSIARTLMVERTSGAALPGGPLGALRSPAPVDRASDLGESDDEPRQRIPAEILDAESLQQLAQAQGIAPGTIRSLAFFPDAIALQQLPIFSAEEGTGLDLWIDPAAGAARSVSTRTVRTTSEPGLLPLGTVEGGVDAPARASFAALSAPETLAASAAATAAGIGLLVLLVKVLLVPLYTRLRRDRLLDNPVRARLYERVRAEPGIHRAELVDYAGIGEGATRHHLAQLVKHKLLVELAQEGSGFARYFAAGEVPPDVARREATLRAGSQRAVYELYAREPQLSLRDAAARLGMSAPSVHRAKKKLEQAGLLPAAPSAAASVAEA